MALCIISFLCIILLFCSCTKEGPMGPTGATGSTGLQDKQGPGGETSINDA